MKKKSKEPNRFFEGNEEGNPGFKSSSVISTQEDRRIVTEDSKTGTNNAGYESPMVTYRADLSEDARLKQISEILARGVLRLVESKAQKRRKRK